MLGHVDSPDCAAFSWRGREVKRAPVRRVPTKKPRGNCIVGGAFMRRGVGLAIISAPGCTTGCPRIARHNPNQSVTWHCPKSRRWKREPVEALAWVGRASTGGHQQRVPEGSTGYPKIAQHNPTKSVPWHCTRKSRSGILALISTLRGK